jgi:hypothetical protein
MSRPLKETFKLWQGRGQGSGADAQRKVRFRILRLRQGNE